MSAENQTSTCESKQAVSSSPTESYLEQYKAFRYPESCKLQETQLASVKAKLEEDGKLKLGSLIGRGRFAEVYRATLCTRVKSPKSLDGFKVRNLEMAVKIIDRNQLPDQFREQHWDHFRSMIVSGCQDKMSVEKNRTVRLIKLYASQCTAAGSLFYYLMEYLSHGTLCDLIVHKGALKEPVSRALFRRLTQAVAFLHDNQGTAHRDIRPEKVLLNEQWIPKLMHSYYMVKFDATQDPLRTDFDAFGPLPFKAPELLARQPYNPLVTDMWSLGVCLFIITNDQFPFRTFADPVAMLTRQRAREWQFSNQLRSDYPPSYKELVRVMLEPEPGGRARAISVLEHEWCKVSHANSPPP